MFNLLRLAMLIQKFQILTEKFNDDSITDEEKDEYKLILEEMNNELGFN